MKQENNFTTAIDNLNNTYVPNPFNLPRPEESNNIQQVKLTPKGVEKDKKDKDSENVQARKDAEKIMDTTQWNGNATAIDDLQPSNGTSMWSQINSFDSNFLKQIENGDKYASKVVDELKGNQDSYTTYNYADKVETTKTPQFDLEWYKRKAKERINELSADPKKYAKQIERLQAFVDDKDFGRGEYYESVIDDNGEFHAVNSTVKGDLTDKDTGELLGNFDDFSNGKLKEDRASKPTEEPVNNKVEPEPVSEGSSKPVSPQPVSPQPSKPVYTVESVWNDGLNGNYNSYSNSNVTAQQIVDTYYDKDKEALRNWISNYKGDKTRLTAAFKTKEAKEEQTKAKANYDNIKSRYNNWDKLSENWFIAKKLYAEQGKEALNEWAKNLPTDELDDYNNFVRSINNKEFSEDEISKGARAASWDDLEFKIMTIGKVDPSSRDELNKAIEMTSDENWEKFFDSKESADNLRIGAENALHNLDVAEERKRYEEEVANKPNVPVSNETDPVSNETNIPDPTEASSEVVNETLNVPKSQTETRPSGSLGENNSKVAPETTAKLRKKYSQKDMDDYEKENKTVANLSDMSPKAQEIAKESAAISNPIKTAEETIDECSKNVDSAFDERIAELQAELQAELKRGNEANGAEVSRLKKEISTLQACKEQAKINSNLTKEQLTKIAFETPQTAKSGVEQNKEFNKIEVKGILNHYVDGDYGKVLSKKEKEELNNYLEKGLITKEQYDASIKEDRNAKATMLYLIGDMVGESGRYIASLISGTSYTPNALYQKIENAYVESKLEAQGSAQKDYSKRITESFNNIVKNSTENVKREFEMLWKSLGDDYMMKLSDAQKQQALDTLNEVSKTYANYPIEARVNIARYQIMNGNKSVIEGLSEMALEGATDLINHILSGEISDVSNFANAFGLLPTGNVFNVDFSNIGNSSSATGDVSLNSTNSNGEPFDTTMENADKSWFVQGMSKYLGALSIVGGIGSFPLVASMGVTTGLSAGAKQNAINKTALATYLVEKSNDKNVSVAKKDEEGTLSFPKWEAFAEKNGWEKAFASDNEKLGIVDEDSINSLDAVKEVFKAKEAFYNEPEDSPFAQFQDMNHIKRLWTKYGTELATNAYYGKLKKAKDKEGIIALSEYLNTVDIDEDIKKKVSKESTKCLLDVANSLGTSPNGFTFKFEWKKENEKEVLMPVAYKDKKKLGSWNSTVASDLSKLIESNEFAKEFIKPKLESKALNSGTNVKTKNGQIGMGNGIEEIIGDMLYNKSMPDDVYRLLNSKQSIANNNLANTTGAQV